MGSDDEDIRVVKNATDLQRLKLEKLMKNPEKPAFIPERSKEKKFPNAPEFVRNVMGSSAGAGSGEFHVYRHIRRREYARQQFVHQMSEKERLDEEYRQKLLENERITANKAAKKRAKRQRRKQQLRCKRRKGAQHSPAESSSESESESGGEEESGDPNETSKQSDGEGRDLNMPASNGEESVSNQKLVSSEKENESDDVHETGSNQSSEIDSKTKRLKELLNKNLKRAENDDGV
ncbi:Protein of unknown function DUF1168 [Trinorchestia longiramus]|nr:Protein of unknown function DUF1168 [Trinorchestia longiramus]